FHVTRRDRARQLHTLQNASKGDRQTGKLRFEFLTIGSLTDEYQVSVGPVFAKPPVSRCDELKVLFNSEPSDVDELHKILFVCNSVLSPIAGHPIARMEALDVHPTVKKENLTFSKPALMKQFGSGSRGHNHLIDCMIEKHHVLPRECFQTDVPCVVLHIFRNVGVICRRRFDLKRLCCEQTGKSDSSRSADLYLRETAFLEILQQLEQRRKVDVKSVVLRKIHIGNRGEYLEAARIDEFADTWVGTVFTLFFRAKARDDREPDVAPYRLVDHAFDAHGHTVDFEKRIRQQSDFSGLLELEGFTNFTGHKAIRRLLEKCDQVRHRDE